MSRRRKHQPQRKAWQPLKRVPIDPAYAARQRKAAADAGLDQRAVDAEMPTEVWINDVYQVLVKRDGRQLSIHRHDRRAVRDWRHLQQIKNEVAGPEATAVEVFPPSSMLVDTSNEYHLFVLDHDLELFAGRTVLDSVGVNAGRVRGKHKARQRPLQPGLEL